MSGHKYRLIIELEVTEERQFHVEQVVNSVSLFLRGYFEGKGISISKIDVQFSTNAYELMVYEQDDNDFPVTSFLVFYDLASPGLKYINIVDGSSLASEFMYKPDFFLNLVGYLNNKHKVRQAIYLLDANFKEYSVVFDDIESFRKNHELVNYYKG